MLCKIKKCLESLFYKDFRLFQMLSRVAWFCLNLDLFQSFGYTWATKNRGDSGVKYGKIYFVLVDITHNMYRIRVNPALPNNLLKP
ncbi:hypothetical protein BSK52_00510 [Paenibacillus odorifer]|uniref:Uncharacterized protein n=1 Tax=Paenibacillus odorifer TaxID=189426 RepID=A0A1R0Y9I7_9BACL|nr:hypothetical protein BSK52_00510 [Paenibacillus odorifer]